MDRSQFADAMEFVGRMYEAWANNELSYAEFERAPGAADARRAAADVLSAVAFAFGECTQAGTAAPLHELHQLTTEWLDSRTDFVVAVEQQEAPGVDPLELIRLANDGNPHASEAA
jgi:hypothetical protein